MELKAAQRQIGMLTDANRHLNEQCHQLREEKQFMEEQQQATQKQLDNLSHINQQLRQQLDKVDPPTVQSRGRDGLSNYSSVGSARGSWLGPSSERSTRAGSRENHQSTPKSQIKLDWGLVGAHLNQKKKVFL